MSSPYKNFKTDLVMETEGIWLDYGDYKIRIARAGGQNMAYAKSVEKYAKKHKLALKNDTLDNDVQQALMVQVYADSIILAWEGVVNENDELMSFNRENVVKLLTDLPDLFADIRSSATSLQLFQKELLEKAAKNS